jgi:endoglucanase
MTFACLRLLRAAAFVFAIVPSAAWAGDAEWEAFKKGFLEAEGRVVDTGQGRISHSEGQGFAMLLATHHDDREAFDRLWKWTKERLQVREDALLAWRWEAGRGVTDRNNASDGDLLVAWALLRAGERWKAPAYTDEGRKLAQEVRRKLLKRGTHGLVLLPGVDGFDKADGLVVNLSYWVFPAFADLNRADPAPEWEELAGNGLAMLQYAYFGRWALPPDWLKLSAPVAPADRFPARFGFDAVRIPVYLLWSRRETPALLKPYREFWSAFDGARVLPAFTNLLDDSVDSRGAGSGIRAIARAVADFPDARVERLPGLDADGSYYQSVLLLLCKAALRERGR